MTKPGVYNKRVNGTMRRVRIKANGQWQFLKGKPTAKKATKKRGSKTKKKHKKKGGSKTKKKQTGGHKKRSRGVLFK